MVQDDKDQQDAPMSYALLTRQAEVRAETAVLQMSNIRLTAKCAKLITEADTLAKLHNICRVEE